MNLIYVGDPMCSWCYGFAAPLDQLLADPQAAEPVGMLIVLGGLRPFTKEPMTPERADELAGHWRQVAQASGQAFTQAPDTAMHQPGFTYDTEPASRAVVAVRNHWPDVTWEYFKAVQHAFYTEARNVTEAVVLADVAEALGVPRDAFTEAFESQAMRDATLRDFQRSQGWGIQGFPTVLAEHGDHLHLVGSGFMPIDVLRQKLTAATQAHAH